MENTLHDEKSIKISDISVNNRTAWEKTVDPLFNPRLSWLAKKPSHATVPLKVIHEL